MHQRRPSVYSGAHTDTPRHTHTDPPAHSRTHTILNAVREQPTLYAPTVALAHSHISVGINPSWTFRGLTQKSAASIGVSSVGSFSCMLSLSAKHKLGQGRARGIWTGEISAEGADASSWAAVACQQVCMNLPEYFHGNILAIAEEPLTNVYFISNHLFLVNCHRPRQGLFLSWF